MTVNSYFWKEMTGYQDGNMPLRHGYCFRCYGNSFLSWTAEREKHRSNSNDNYCLSAFKLTYLTFN